MNGPNVPPVRAIVALVSLIAIAVAGGIVLYVLTPSGQRPNVWAALPAQWPALLAGCTALGAWLSGRAAHNKLDTITDQTNGVLSQRIEDIVRAVLAEFTTPPTGAGVQLVPAQPAAAATQADAGAAPAAPVTNTRAG